jgi:transcriptional regulator with XRE-family HTH domain
MALLDRVATGLPARSVPQKRAGMNQTELATACLCSRSHISDIEQGHILPTHDELRHMEQALDADGVLLELYGMLNIGMQESATVADAEKDALAISMYENRTVPGLLETPDYMRAALSTGVPPNRLDREVPIRRARQKILSSLKSATASVVLVRDTTDQAGSTLSLTPGAWTASLVALR